MPRDRDFQLWIPSPPCVVHACANYSECKEQLLACKAFMRFVVAGAISAPTIPSRRIYIHVFSEFTSTRRRRKPGVQRATLAPERCPATDLLAHYRSPAEDASGRSTG